MASWSATAGRFALHRLLRSYPGSWMSLALTAFVLAPASCLIDGSYSLSSAVRFVLAHVNAFGEQQAIGGTLPGVPFFTARVKYPVEVLSR